MAKKLKEIRLELVHLLSPYKAGTANFTRVDRLTVSLVPALEVVAGRLTSPVAA